MELKATGNLKRQNNRPVRKLEVLSIPLILVTGIVLALLTVTFHYLAVILVIGLFLVLPWLLREPFRLYIWLLITWPVLTLYLRASTDNASGDIPSITYERILVPMLLGLLLVHGLAFRKKLPQISVFILLYVAAQVITRLALFFLGGAGEADIVYLLNTVVLPITMYWITKTLVTSRERLNSVLYALMIVSIIVCLSGLYERAIDAQVSPYPIGSFSTLGQTRWLDVPGGRAAGIVGNPAIFGGVLGIGIFAGLCGFVQTKGRPIQYFIGTAILLLVYGVFVSFTRAAWLAVAGVLFVLQFVIGKLWKMALPIFILVILAGMIFISSSAGARLLESRIQNPETIIARLEMIQVALDQFVQRPILGWGPGAYNQFIFDYVQGDSRAYGASSSHNTYLTLLVDGGLVLLTSFALMIAAFLWKAAQVIRQASPDSHERNVAWAMLGCIVVFLLLGLTNDLRDFIYFNVLLFVVAAIIENLSLLMKSPTNAWLIDRNARE